MSDPTAPQSGEPGHGNPNERGSGLAGLRVLFPYARQVRWFLVASGAAALTAMLSGMAIPLVTQRIIDGPLVDGDLRQLAWLIVVVLALGIAEAGMILVRRMLVAGPVTSLEHRMRMDLYGLLQRLPVAFHDRWQSGQLLSRAVSDLTIIRRFLAFGGIFLVVNAISLAVGLIVLFWLYVPFGLIVAASAVPMVILSYRYESRYKV